MIFILTNPLRPSKEREEQEVNMKCALFSAQVAFYSTFRKQMLLDLKTKALFTVSRLKPGAKCQPAA